LLAGNKKRIKYGNKKETAELSPTIPYEKKGVINEEDTYKTTKEC
jgi:hypothetical protein